MLKDFRILKPPLLSMPHLKLLFLVYETATIIDASLKTVVSRLYHGRKLFQRNLWRYIEERP